MNLLEPEGRFWSLFTPWHGDDLTARQKKVPAFCAFPHADLLGFPADQAREECAKTAHGAKTRSERTPPGLHPSPIGWSGTRRPSAAESRRESRMSVLLSAQGLTKSYGHRPLFAGLSFDLRAGERVGLIGPNGAGKSTLLRLLAGREAPDEGTVSARRGARIGYLAAGRHLRRPATPPARSCSPPSPTTTSKTTSARRAPPSPSRRSASPTPTSRPTPSPAAGGSGSPSPANSPASPTSCCSTSRPTTSTCPASSGSNGCCATPTSATSSPPTTGRSSGPSPRTSSRSAASTPAGSSAPTAATTTFADKRDQFLEAQARQREAVANQVRRETEWLGAQGVGPAAEVAVADRGGGGPAGRTRRPELPHRRGRGRRHRLRRHRPADEEAPHRRRASASRSAAGRSSPDST